jgi:protein TonB
LKPRAGLAALLLVAFTGAAVLRGAETQPAVQTQYKDPVYPDNLWKTQVQGNVLLVGRIDKMGRVTDLHVVAASHRDFIAPSLAAVRAWRFRPATRDGVPVEISVNIGVRFRLQNEHRGQIASPILGDLAISPADSKGRPTAPEGFPLRRGQDAGLKAEVLLDVPPQPQARTLTVRVEAISPSGKRIAVFQPPVAAPANAAEVRFPVFELVGRDWEEGVWSLLFTVDGANAGGGQFWLASDPARFHFEIPGDP